MKPSWVSVTGLESPGGLSCVAVGPCESSRRLPYPCCLPPPPLLRSLSLSFSLLPLVLLSGRLDSSCQCIDDLASLPLGAFKIKAGHFHSVAWWWNNYINTFISSNIPQKEKSSGILLLLQLLAQVKILYHIYYYNYKYYLFTALKILLLSKWHTANM